MKVFIVEMKETRLLSFRIEAETQEEAQEAAMAAEDPFLEQFDERVLHTCEEE